MKRLLFFILNSSLQYLSFSRCTVPLWGASLLILMAACSKTVKVNDLKIIPEPVSIEKNEQTFLLEDNISISISGLGQNSNTVKYILNSLRHGHIQPNLVSHNERSIMQLIVRDSLDPRLGNEGYRLQSTPASITLAANR